MANQREKFKLTLTSVPPACGQSELFVIPEVLLQDVDGWHFAAVEHHLQLSSLKQSLHE